MSKKTSKTLLFLTGCFPYMPGEEFIETEIKYTAQYFEDVIILPQGTKGVQRELPSNCNVIPYYSLFEKQIINLNTIQKSEVLKLYAKLFFKFKPYKPYLLNRRQLLSYCIEVIRKKNCLLNFLSARHLNYKEVVFYSYWNNDEVTFLSLCNLLGYDFKIIARAHEADLYDKNNVNGFFLFREQNIQGLDKLVLISNQGLNYITNKYPIYKNKFVLSYLGTNKVTSQRVTENNRLQIVSCSYINKRKRIHIIIEILKNINLELDWTHIGDGDELLKNELISKASSELPVSVSFNFIGHKSNSEVLKYYSEHHIDLFLLVSESEGLPVSLMEVASFGIPMCATNVGGVSEIVNSTTGILIDADFDPKEVAKKISEYLQNRNEATRKDIENFWNATFNAKVNYTHFSEQILLN